MADRSRRFFSHFTCAATRRVQDEVGSQRPFLTSVIVSHAAPTYLPAVSSRIVLTYLRQARMRSWALHTLLCCLSRSCQSTALQYDVIRNVQSLHESSSPWQFAILLSTLVSPTDPLARGGGGTSTCSPRRDCPGHSAL